MRKGNRHGRLMDVRIPLLGAILCVGSALSAVAAESPKVSLSKLEALPIQVASPYDNRVNADEQVNAAIAKAHQSGKRVLLELGGNWCPDCVILSNMMLLPEVAPFIADHYEVVLVDVGRFNKNMQIPRRFGVNERIEGAPALLVLDSDGKLLDAGHLTELDTARTMQPQAIVDWLVRWAG
jgi:thiol-disulfide isomerase/thioredoxin